MPNGGDIISSKTARGSRRSHPRRRGSAMLELALAMPMVLAMGFGIVEFGQYMYIRYAFVAAVRDAARAAIMSNATQTQVTTTVTNTLAQANVTYNSSWLTITDLGPSSSGAISNVANVPVGDQMQFTLSANYSSIPNAVRPLYQFTGMGIGSNKTVSAICTMVKE